MYTYQCSKCGKFQYLSSLEKENEPCVYCGFSETKIVNNSGQPEVERENNNE